MMHMTLYWGKDVTLLVDSWRTDSWPSYILSLLACFAASALYQCLEDRRLRFKVARAPPRSEPSIAAPLLVSKLGGCGGGVVRAASAALFGASSAVGYLLMLAVMSFNGGVLAAIVVGLSVGYFVFRGGDDINEEIVAVDNPCACA